jgi:hypothetical protein
MSIAPNYSSPRPRGAVLTAATNDSIGGLWMTLCASFYPPNAMALEVFDITDGMPSLSDLVETTYYPGADLDNANLNAYGRGPYNGFTPSQTDVWRAIVNPTMTKGTLLLSDSLPAWPVDNNAFTMTTQGDAYTYFFQLDGIDGQHSNQWITRLRHYWYVQRFSNGDDKASVGVQSMIRIAGNAYPGDSVTYSDEVPGGHLVITDWYNDPSTGLPWTPNILDRFDPINGQDYGFGFQTTGTGVFSVIPLIFHSNVVVEAAPTDQRLAIGAVATSTPTQGWQHVLLRDPNNSLVEQTVDLVSNHRYLWQWRLTRYLQGTGFGMAICRLDQPGVNLPGPPFWTSMNVPLDAHTHRINGLGAEQSVVSGMLLQVGSGYSEDSEFYAETAPTGLDTPNAWPDISAFFNIAPVDIIHSFHQKFTPTNTDEYGWLRIRVCTAVGTVLDDLRILIFRVSDGEHMAPIIHVSADDLTSPNTQWQIYQVRLDDIPLVAGTQYAFAVFSATTHRQGWLVQVANAGLPTGTPGGPPAASWDVAWGGSSTPPDTFTAFNTELVNPDPGTVWPATAELSISTIPDTPTGFDALPGAVVCELQPVDITWVNPVLPDGCGGFLASEIQRSDDAGVTWNAISYITDEFVGSFTDYEWQPAPRYRMRVWRGDGVPSDFTDVVAVDIDVPDDTCGLWFTSNESPDLNVFYPDIAEGKFPPRPFTFPVARQVFQPKNRNYQLVYQEIEDRGSMFTATVLVRSGTVNTDGMPCVADPCADYDLAGVNVFDPLREIARADLSYVCVRNEHGNRWLASINVPSGQWLVPCEIFTAEVEVIEVTDRPSTPDATAAS